MALTGPATAAPGQHRRPDRSPAVRLSTILAVLSVSPLLRLAALRYAVPSGTASRTGCDACGEPVGLTRPWPALTPVGRCGRCRAPVGPPPGIVEVAALAAVVLLVLVGPAAGALPWEDGFAPGLAPLQVLIGDPPGPRAV